MAAPLTPPSPITLEYAQERLSMWMAALDAASTGASYSVDGQTVTRQDVDSIRAEIQRWHITVTSITERLKGNVRPMSATAAFATPGRGGAGGIIPQSLWTDWRT